MSTKVFFIVALEEDVAVVFFLMTPVVRIVRAAVDHGTPSFADIADPSLFLLTATVATWSVHGQALSFLAILQGRDQIPDEAANLLVAAIVPQAVQQNDTCAVLDVDLAPSASELTVLEDLLPTTPTESQ